MQPEVVWVCRKCGKVESTPEGQTPSIATRCHTDIATHDWHPVAHQVVVAAPKGAE